MRPLLQPYNLKYYNSYSKAIPSTIATPNTIATPSTIATLSTTTTSNTIAII